MWNWERVLPEPGHPPVEEVKGYEEPGVVSLIPWPLGKGPLTKQDPPKKTKNVTSTVRSDKHIKG